MHFENNSEMNTVIAHSEQQFWAFHSLEHIRTSHVF